MRADRHRRVQRQLQEQNLDGALLLGTSNVAYATGTELPGEDSGRATLFRTVALVLKEDEFPHLFTPYPDAAPIDLPGSHLHGPLFPDLGEGLPLLGSGLAGLLPERPRLAVDDITYPMMASLGQVDWRDARSVLAPCKITKTVDEVSCIRLAQRLTELAMDITRESLRPGLRQTDLTATFLRRVFDLGATANSIDPIWQVMTPAKAAGPWTTHGGLAYPTSTTDRLLRAGDIIWVDAGISHHGYSSDYGRTWITTVEAKPTARQQSQFERWSAVVAAALAACRPGATGLEIGRAASAANGGTRPWMEHFYLAHGVGTDSAEMPLIGTDLGDAFDDTLIMTPGMVLVFEPVIWDDGHGGYRAEDVVAVTDQGWVSLSSDQYDPYRLSA
jgi:Xaa-Pro aminopeptidase